MKDGIDVRDYGNCVEIIVMLMASGNLDYDEFYWVNQLLLNRLMDNKDMYKWSIHNKEKEYKKYMWKKSIQLKQRGIINKEEMNEMKRLFKYWED